MRIVRVQDAATDIALLLRNKVVVFAGYGVSIWEPTTLPSGASVTSAIWETLLSGIPLSFDESNLLADKGSGSPKILRFSLQWAIRFPSFNTA